MPVAKSGQGTRVIVRTNLFGITEISDGKTTGSDNERFKDP
jgi:hypothetical protein